MTTAEQNYQWAHRNDTFAQIAADRQAAISRGMPSHVFTRPPQTEQPQQQPNHTFSRGPVSTTPMGSAYAPQPVSYAPAPMDPAMPVASPIVGMENLGVLPSRSPR
ncbi:MAG: hypothetical protein WBH47_09960 [Streptosporangiaceae bacterium]